MIKELMHNPIFLAGKSEVATKEDLHVAQDLLDTLMAHRESCVGMAANMIGVRKCIIAFLDESGRVPTYTVMLNPEIIKKDGAYDTEEGCLSLLGCPRKCKRYKTIKVQYQTLEMQTRIKNFTGWTAQIIQHEVDHCNGVLILCRENKMTVNYFIKCPICGAITRMRSPAGYIYSTPVRIHCGSCNTLLSGEFISDNEKIKAYYKPFNCESISTREYDYYGEASGELLCAKIITQKSSVEETLMPRPSPVFAFMSAMGEEEREAYINYACYASDWSKNTDKNRVKYDLYLNKKYELLKSKYANVALKNGYDLSSRVYQYIYYSMFYDCGGIFKKSDIVEILRDINCHFYHLDKASLNAYLELLEKDNRIERAENKLYTAFLEFQKIAPNLMPAVAVTYYEHPENIDKTSEGLTTCTFEDISHFYQDTFEVLAEFCDIVIGLDNIENRNGFDVFPNKLNMEKLHEQKKGNRIKFLNATEFFANCFNLDSGFNDLRNAIGHKNYSYNGIEQEIVYAPKETSSEMSSKYLIEVALECVSLMKSVYVLLFYVYELKRYLFLKNGEGSFLHPLFYKRIKSQNHCECGSGKKYRDCCKKVIEKKVEQLIKRNILKKLAWIYQ